MGVNRLLTLRNLKLYSKHKKQQTKKQDADLHEGLGGLAKPRRPRLLPVDRSGGHGGHRQSSQAFMIPTTTLALTLTCSVCMYVQSSTRSSKTRKEQRRGRGGSVLETATRASEWVVLCIPRRQLLRGGVCSTANSATRHVWEEQRGKGAAAAGRLNLENRLVHAIPPALLSTCMMSACHAAVTGAGSTCEHVL